tara:strand:+ start:218 stop:2026 length:1809 start_codon:yes stop_codon:yes gene_type:complete
MVLGIKLLSKNKWVALLIFVILSLLFLFPIFNNFTNWGVHDWDQHYFYNGVPRRTILEFKQFPLWNPYYCGGTPMLANPQSAFLSPVYILILLFGAAQGLKIGIIVHFIIGLYGMFLLSKHFKLGKFSSYLPAVIYIFSSWFTLRMLAGHTIYMPMAFIPYVFLFYLKGLKETKYSFISALFLAIMILGGGTYPFYFIMIILGIYSVLILFKNLSKNEEWIKAFRPLFNLFLIIILVLLLSAIKVLPAYSFMKGSDIGTEDIQYYSSSIFFKSLLGREQRPWIMETEFGLQHDESDENYLINRLMGKVPWAWHEYGAYIGIIPLLLFLFSFLYYKKLWPLQTIALVLLALTFGKAMPFNLWNLIRQFPYLNSLHGPSRFIMPFMFLLAIISGYALSRFEKKNLKYKGINVSRIIVLLIVVIVFIDLLLVSSPILRNMFSREAIKIDTSQYPNFMQILSSDKYFSQYPNFLQNLGTVNCYERVHLTTRIMPKFFDDGREVEEFKGDAYYPELNKTAEQVYFSPNKLKVKVDVDKKTLLVINQNFHPAWKAKDKKVFGYNGLIAVEVNPEDEMISFYYLPNSFIIGLIVSVLTLIVGVLMYGRI